MGSHLSGVKSPSLIQVLLFLEGLYREQLPAKLGEQDWAPCAAQGDELCLLGSAFSLIQKNQFQQHREARPGMGAPQLALPAPAQLVLQNNLGFGFDLLAQQGNPQTELMGQR